MTDEKQPQGETIEEATEKGYFGTVPDETPNEAYTVAGQVAGMSTPEAPDPAAQTGDVKASTREDVAPADKGKR